MTAPARLKIALTTNSLTRVDCAFALAKQIVFYNVGRDEAEFIDVVRIGAGEVPSAEHRGKAKNGGVCWMDEAEATGAGGDRIAPRVEAVKGCHMLFTKGLSDLAAVKLRDAGVFSVKMESARDIDDCILYLQKMLKGHPPLFLRKALGYVAPNSLAVPGRDIDSMAEGGTPAAVLSA